MVVQGEVMTAAAPGNDGSRDALVMPHVPMDAKSTHTTAQPLDRHATRPRSRTRAVVLVGAGFAAGSLVSVGLWALTLWVAWHLSF